jgi:hypothetical protein
MGRAFAALGFAVGIIGLAALAAGEGAPYAAKVNPLNDPDFVPIMVNTQNVGNAKIYAAAGINVFDDVDDITEEPKEAYQHKPTAETLKVLSDLGIYLIAQQPVWKEQMDNPTIIAWVSPVDEPDNVQGGTGKGMPLAEYLAAAKAFKANDPTRPFVVCFGQGLINDRYHGRGIDRAEYPKYMAVVDFIEYDVYPITNAHYFDVDPATKVKKEYGEKHLDLVGQGVSRIRGYTENKKPAICWIETNHIKNADVAPTPAQTACEVWDTMVHGARGVGYFCHDFTLKAKTASALSRDEGMLTQLKITNGKLKKLARIISTPLATEPATAKSEGGEVIASTKMVEGKTVVLSVNVQGEKAAATIAVAGLKKGAKVEVLEEGRTIEAGDGAIVDDFAGYQEHVYRVE